MMTSKIQIFKGCYIKLIQLLIVRRKMRKLEIHYQEDRNVGIISRDFQRRTLMISMRKSMSSVFIARRNCMLILKDQEHPTYCTMGENVLKKNHWKKRKMNLKKDLGFDPIRHSQGGKPHLIMVQWSEERIREALIRMIIMDEQPFRLVEKEGFKQFMKVIDPRFRIPSRMTMMRDSAKLYMMETQKVMRWFSTSGSRMSLTTDTWTSIQNLNYMCLTGHFIDNDWKLHKKILNFRKMTGHKGSEIAHDVEQCLHEWGIECILAITVDNASANDVAIDLLKKKMKLRSEPSTSSSSQSKSPILDNNYMHVRCTAHILNLIVQEGLKDHDQSIVRVRGAVKYVKASPARSDSFKQIVIREGICTKEFVVLDVPTRWNSTYKMLDVAGKYRAAFQTLSIQDGGFERNFGEIGPPTDEDWDQIKIFAKFLKISASTYPTSNIYLQDVSKIWMNLKKSMQSPITIVRNMATRMMEKYKKYWGSQDKINKLLFIAVVLDPRYKIDALEDWWTESIGVSTAHSLVKDLKETLYKMYDSYNVGVIRTLTPTSTPATIPNSDDDDEWCYHWCTKKRKIGGVHEIERYLKDDSDSFIPTLDLDILLWWKENKSRYPILSNIARDVLAIPTSTVASESTFSTGGRVLDAFRSSLAPKTAECLICLQDWLKYNDGSAHDLDDLLEDLVSIEVDEEIATKKICVDG